MDKNELTKILIHNVEPTARKLGVKNVYFNLRELAFDSLTGDKIENMCDKLLDAVYEECSYGEGFQKNRVIRFI